MATSPASKVASGSVSTGSDAALPADPRPTVPWAFADDPPPPPPPPPPPLDVAAVDAPALGTRKSRAGRRPGAVWAFFAPLRTEQNKTHATCRFCARRCAGVAARMAAHLLTKCPSVPPHELEALRAALAQEPPPEKRQRLASGGGGTGADVATAMGLAAFGGDGAPSRRELLTPLTSDALAAAMRKLVVACLRRRVPLELLDDADLRDALAALRPDAAAAIRATSAAALVASVGAAVAHETAQWMRASESFTFAHRALHDGKRTSEWRGVDQRRRCALLAEDAPPSPRVAFLTSQLTLFPSETVVGLCCDSSDAFDALAGEAARPDSPLARVSLLGRCLLAESLRLWALVVDAAPQVLAVTHGAAEIAQVYAAHPQAPSTLDASDDQLAGLCAGWSLPFTLLKRLHAMSPSLPETGATVSDEEPAKAAARSEFWTNLAAVDALLAPFAWLFALSESRSVASSQLVLGWIWLLAAIERCPLVVASEPPLVQRVFETLRGSVADHHLVALLLDPRTRGAGLSVTGRRKAKTLVAHVATRLWGRASTSASTSASDQGNVCDEPPPPAWRAALLAQLGHYVDRTAYFADDVVWEMARGAAPESFWRDYTQDAPELARLAAAVLAFAPVASATSELLERVDQQKESGRAAAAAFDVRQIRFHHHERDPTAGDAAGDMAAVVARHGELLLLPDGALSASPPPLTTASRLAPETLPSAVDAEMQRLQAAAVATALSAADRAPLVAGVDLSWFAFQSDAQRVEIETALRHTLPLAGVASDADAAAALVV